MDASRLTPERFYSEFVEQLRPCLIRGAVRHWPAFERWRDRDYLTRALRGVRVEGVQRYPTMEYPWRPHVWPRFRAAYKRARATRMPADVLFERLSRGEFLFTYACEVSSSSTLAPIAGDVATFPFLPSWIASGEPRLYARARVFFHGRSYTDWHAHGTDETLMCQFGAPKRVALLGPGRKVFDAMMEVYSREEYNLFDTLRYPKLAELAPQVFIVEPGDATYLPPYVWHAVETVDETPSFGATLAVCWASTPRVHLDRRIPFRAFLVENVWSKGARAIFEDAWERHWVPLHEQGRSLPASLME